MKALLLVPVLACAAALSGCMAPSAKSLEGEVNSDAPVAKAEKQPVLVELFTSEGCSSCPPADKVLMVLANNQLVSNADVITLGYHVDYWDHYGWKDRFSAHAYSVRQEAYARAFKLSGPYTPQMVVDGARELVGSEGSSVIDVVAASAKEPKAAVILKIVDDKLQVAITGLGSHSDSKVYLAIAESKLSTDVKGGENSGTKLQHTSVVRLLTEIGSIGSSESKGSFEAVISNDDEWKSENLRYVVFVQDASTHRILAVKQITR